MNRKERNFWIKKGGLKILNKKIQELASMMHLIKSLDRLIHWSSIGKIAWDNELSAATEDAKMVNTYSAFEVRVEKRCSRVFHLISESLLGFGLAICLSNWKILFSEEPLILSLPRRSSKTHQVVGGSGATRLDGDVKVSTIQAGRIIPSSPNILSVQEYNLRAISADGDRIVDLHTSSLAFLVKAIPLTKSFWPSVCALRLEINNWKAIIQKLFVTKENVRACASCS